MTITTGGCPCGAVRIRADGEPLRTGLCHCLDCRKHHGAVFFAAAIFPRARVEVDGATQASDGRHRCAACGAPVFAVSGAEIELHLGTLDAPGQFTPDYELWTCRREPWLAPIPGAAQFEKGRDEGT